MLAEYCPSRLGNIETPAHVESRKPDGFNQKGNHRQINLHDGFYYFLSYCALGTSWDLVDVVLFLGRCFSLFMFFRGWAAAPVGIQHSPGR